MVHRALALALLAAISILGTAQAQMVGGRIWDFPVAGLLPYGSSDTGLDNTTGLPDTFLYSVIDGRLEQRTFGTPPGRARIFAGAMGTLPGTGFFISQASSLQFDLRLRILDLGGVGGVGFEIGDGLHLTQVLATPFGLEIPIQGGGLASLPWTGIDPAFDPTQWHDYRIERPAGAAAFDLFVDEVLVFSGLGTPSPKVGVAWGDLSDAPGAGADVDWDHVRLYDGGLPDFAGNVGAAYGQLEDVLKIDGQAGGFLRTVQKGLGEPFTFTLEQPQGSIGQGDFIIFGCYGVPTAQDAFDTGFGFMSFLPAPLLPSANTLFTLVSTFDGTNISGPLNGTWSFTVAGGPIDEFRFCFQGVIYDSSAPGSGWSVTNGIELWVY